MPKFMKQLNNISRCQALYRSKALLSEELCAGHHAYILAIGNAPGRSQDEIAAELCLNKSTVTRTLGYLEAHGYITRTPDPHDRRRMSVVPTDKLNDVLPEIRRVAREWNTHLTAQIPEEEMAVFHAVLLRMEESAKALIQSEGVAL